MKKLISTALITGALGPLGQTITSKFIDSGYKLILTDKQDSIPDSSYLRSQNITYISADLSKDNSLKDLTDYCNNHLENLNVIINNAGLTGDSGLSGYMTNLNNQTNEAFMAAIRINLIAPFAIIRDLAPLMAKSPKASIVNISSIYSLVGPQPKLYENQNLRSTPAAYAASKAGLNQLTRYFASVLAPSIRVNAVAAGGIERNQKKEFIEKYSSFTPLQRMATPEEISDVIFWLANDKSSYVNGQVVVADGGWTVW